MTTIFSITVNTKEELPDRTIYDFIVTYNDQTVETFPAFKRKTKIDLLDFQENEKIYYCLTDEMLEVLGTDPMVDNVSEFTKLSYTLIPSGTECLNTISSVGGYSLMKDSSFIAPVLGLGSPGKIYTIKFTEPPLNREILTDCCLNQNCVFGNIKNKKMSSYSNNFETQHCNTLMKPYCDSVSFKEQNCLNWLTNRIKKNDLVQFHSLIDTCRFNLTSMECSYLMDSLYQENNSYFYDLILDSYCSLFNDNEKCKCYNQIKNPDIKIPDKLIDNFGSIRCWLAECNTLLTDPNFIPFVNRKENCNKINCSVNIDKLNLGENVLMKILNFCNGGYETGNYSKDKLVKFQTWGSGFNIFFFLILLIFIFYFMIF